MSPSLQQGLEPPLSHAPLVHEHRPQPGKNPCPWRDRRAHARRCPACRHVGADMAMANDLMQLPVAHFEEAFGFAISVVPQALGAKDRILESDRDRRSVCAHSLAHLGRGVFGACERREAARTLFEKLRPAFEALAAIGDGSRCFGLNVGNGVDLVKGLMLHGRLLCRQDDHPPAMGIKAPPGAGKSRTGAIESFDRSQPPTRAAIVLEPSGDATVLPACAADRSRRSAWLRRSPRSSGQARHPAGWDRSRACREQFQEKCDRVSVRNCVKTKI